jgi:ethanolamine utilization protein EutN
MRLGRVIGSVVATQKEASLEGVKLLIVEPLDERLAPAGEAIVACDAVQSGPGDIVMFEGGREAAIALSNWFNPSDATIFGIVDRVDARPGSGAR